MHKPIITIGFDKNGEADFGVADIGSISLEDMKELRAMIVVAIGTAEDMFRRAKMNQDPCASPNKNIVLGNITPLS